MQQLHSVIVNMPSKISMPSDPHVEGKMRILVYQPKLTCSMFVLNHTVTLVSHIIAQAWHLTLLYCDYD